MAEPAAAYRLPAYGVLKALLAPVVANWRWIGGCVVVFSISFGGAALLIPPTYRSTTVMLPAAWDRGSPSTEGALAQFGGLASLAGINLGSSDKSSEEALAVLLSEDFTQRFIADNQLLPVLFPGDWDATLKTWKGSGRAQPTLSKGFKRFDEKVRTVIQDKKTGLINVRIDWRDRRIAAEWANQLVSRLNAEMRARAIARANANIEYLEKEYSSATVVSTRDAIGRLLESQIRQRMVAVVSPEYAFRIVDAALVADADDPVRPQKLLLVVLGPLLGLIFAVGVIGVAKTF